MKESDLQTYAMSSSQTATSRHALLMTAAVLAVSSARAAESETLDEEFLEYLAEFDGEDDLWAWLAQDDDDETAKSDQAAAPASREDKVKP